MEDRDIKNIDMRSADVKPPRIILASASPRRRELMRLAGYEFEVLTSEKEERYKSSTPGEIVKELALLKATDVAGKIPRNHVIVIGADTVVSCGGRILGKPGSKEEAFRMIQSFQGQTHQVYTGVAILTYDREGKESISCEAVRTDVHVSPMADEEICAYIESENVMDKAGAYGIQGKFARYVEKIEGDFYNVVGLPISYIYQALK